ncbi:MAG TPA: glutaredoxin family protein [Gallionella sp.]
MRHLFLLMVILGMNPVATGAGELFRWVDENGKVHYGDAPPASAHAERKKFGGKVEQGEEISFEASRAQQNFPVTLYVSDTCKEPCTQARDLLRKRGVPYSEKMLVSKSEIDEFQKQSGSSNAPTLKIGTTYLGGYSESKWNSELDIAGYPKAATYRQLNAPQPQSQSGAPKSDANPGAEAVPAAQ